MQTPTIITLCGSTKFKEEFEEWDKRLTLAGAIVLKPGIFHHSGDQIKEEQKLALDKLHKHKILMSDIVFVINKDNYIGSSTQSEIDFANTLDIPVIFCYNDNIENNEVKEIEEILL